MSFVWCEWICLRCGDIHRAKFDLVIGLKAAYQLKGGIYERKGVFIEDRAFSLKEKPSKKFKSGKGSKIFVKWDTTLERIFAALREFMQEYYAIKEGTLKMEVCRA